VCESRDIHPDHPYKRDSTIGTNPSSGLSLTNLKIHRIRLRMRRSSLDPSAGRQGQVPFFDSPQHMGTPTAVVRHFLIPLSMPYFYKTVVSLMPLDFPYLATFIQQPLAIPRYSIQSARILHYSHDAVPQQVLPLWPVPTRATQLSKPIPCLVSARHIPLRKEY